MTKNDSSMWNFFDEAPCCDERATDAVCDDNVKKLDYDRPSSPHSYATVPAKNSAFGLGLSSLEFGSNKSVSTEPYPDFPDDGKEDDARKRRKIMLGSALFLCIGALFGIGLLVGTKLKSDSGSDRAIASVGTGVENSTQSKQILVGAYYYPWYGDTFHKGAPYLREELSPPQYPTLGEYNDTDPAVIQQHLDWSRQANIGLWITSWWGPDSQTDNTTKSVILGHEDIGDMKIALHYETNGRIKNGDLQNIQPDFEHICETYFNNSNYYRVDGRPVVFIYITRKLEQLGLLEDAVLAMRSTASKCGENLFVVADHVFREAPDEDSTINSPGMISSFVYFDAITNYDVYGSMGSAIYAGEGDVEDYYAEQKGWQEQAAEEGCRYIPAVTPGFNDRSARPVDARKPLSRMLFYDQLPGTLFEYSLSLARKMVDSEMDYLLVVNSFNEWHEDTQIEPCEGGATQLPVQRTAGLNYSAYGELYLDILRDSTAGDVESFLEDNIFSA